MSTKDAIKEVSKQRKISKNIWKESESKIKMSTENETSVLVLIFTPFIQK